MSDADVIIAISEQELTSLSQQTYDAAYPQIFTRAVQYSFEGTTFTIEVDVKAAPVFDLSPSDVVKQAVISALTEQIKQASIEALDVERSSVFLEQQVANCSVRFPQILITIKTPDMRDASLTLVDTTAYCYVQVTNNMITVVPTALTAAQQTDPLYDVLVQKALLPELKSLLTNYLTGLSLPSIAIEGIAFSPLSASIENGHLVAATNLAAKGVPAQPSGVLWVNAGLSVLFSTDVLQAAAVVGLKKEQSSLHDQGSKESWGFGYYWSYSIFPGTPQVALANTDLALTLPVTANVQGGGIAFGQHIGVNYKAIVQPTPHALFSVVVVGNQVHVTFKSMNTVVILLEPTGSVSEHILSWMLAGIANAVSTSGSAAISTFVKNIPFPIITIPTLSPTIEGVTFNVIPSNLTLSNFSGRLAVGGNIIVKKG
jgi:hypothetical protein